MTLSIVWFVIVAFFWTGFFVLEGFDFGVGILHKVIGRTDLERRVAINTVGPVWDGNEVWLVVAGAAMFAAFPPWYASWFSALYLALWLLLAALIIRGVSFEFRGQFDRRGWRSTWSWTLAIGSTVAPLLFGIALGDLLAGLPIDPRGDFTGSFLDLLTPYGLFLGVTLLALCLLHGATFLSIRSTGVVLDRAQAIARRLAIPAAALVAGFVVWTFALARPGYRRHRRVGRPAGGDRRRGGPGARRQGGRTRVRGDSGRDRRHHRVLVRQPLPEPADLHHRCRQQPHRGELDGHPVLAAGDDNRCRGDGSVGVALPGLDLLRVPRPCRRPARAVPRTGPGPPLDPAGPVGTCGSSAGSGQQAPSRGDLPVRSGGGPDDGRGGSSQPGTPG